MYNTDSHRVASTRLDGPYSRICTSVYFMRLLLGALNADTPTEPINIALSEY
jgi:hypothetical protein